MISFTGDVGMFDRKAQYKRIVRINPNLGAILIDFIEDKTKFDEILFSVVGSGELIAHYESMTYTECRQAIRDVIGRYDIIDQIEWHASRHTKCLQLKNNEGENFTFWWWIHADNHEVGCECEVFKEAPEATAYEMAFYD